MIHFEEIVPITLKSIIYLNKVLKKEYKNNK